MEPKKMLVAPVEPDFYRIVRINAAENGISMAELMRQALVKFIRESGEKQEVNHERQPA